MAKGFSLNGKTDSVVASDWLKQNLANYIFYADTNGYEIQEVQIKNIWESSKRTTILYRTVIADSAGKRLEQLYVGSLVSEKRFAKELNEFKKQANGSPTWGPPVSGIPEVGLVLAAFPNDRKMKLFTEGDLLQWADDHKGKLCRWAGLRGCRKTSITVNQCRVEVLKYVPGKRYTAGCDLQLQTPDGDIHTIRFIAKQLSDFKKVRQLYNHLVSLRKSLWRLAHSSNMHAGEENPQPPFLVPQPLGLLEKPPVILIEIFPGDNIKRLLPQLDIEHTMFKLGQKLALFHQADKRVRKKVTYKNEINEVREALAGLRKEFPQWKDKLKKYFEKFEKSCIFDVYSQALLHGSFRLNHVFLTNHQFALLDLDSLRVGPPAYDIANFLSSLYYLQAQERFPADVRKVISKSFLEGYASHAGWEILPEEILWFLSSLLVNKQAIKYINHQHGDRVEKASNMLDLAMHCLEILPNVEGKGSLSHLWSMVP